MDRFLISNFNTGVQTNLKPWMIMDDAFEYMRNAYVWRGRVRKRMGTQLMGPNPLNSQLGIKLGTTDGSGNLSGNLPASQTGAIAEFFSIGTEIYTVATAGTPTTLLDTGTTTTKTLNTSTGAYVFAGAPINTDVYWYPANPVMGIAQYELGQVNNNPTYAFDTQFAYLWNATTLKWNRSGTGTSPFWHGSTINYFWSTTYQEIAGTNAFLVSNFYAVNPDGTGDSSDDPIWYTLDGSTWTGLKGSNAFYFLPNGMATHTGPFVKTALMMFGFKNRLVLFNTIENDGTSSPMGGTNTQYINRARYSWNGDPFTINAWYEANSSDGTNLAAGGGFIDLPTPEAIVSGEFVKDRLIIYCERSTWEFVYTQNENAPFQWQKINTELGSMSTFSTVPFDREVLTVGQSGFHACNGQNVVRIDEKIPEEIFNMETVDFASRRTQGIREYVTETVLWTFQNDTIKSTSIGPNQIIIFNYKNHSWALFDDSVFTFGYIEQDNTITWANSSPTTWENYNGTWESNSLQGNQRHVLCGMTAGAVLILNPDLDRNAPSLYITNITYNGDGTLTLLISNHNLSSSPDEDELYGDFILLENIVGDATTESTLNGSIFAVQSVPAPYEVVITTNGNPTVPPLLSGTYKGGGTAARVSEINIRTKRYNPYYKDNRNFHIQKVDFMVDKTSGGQILIDYYVNNSEVSMIAGGEETNTIMGNGVLETTPYDPNLYPMEQYQQQLCHPIYMQATGEFIQIYMYFDFQEMTNYNNVCGPFEMHSITLYTQTADSRMN